MAKVLTTLNSINSPKYFSGRVKFETIINKLESMMPLSQNSVSVAIKTLYNQAGEDVNVNGLRTAVKDLMYTIYVRAEALTLDRFMIIKSAADLINEVLRDSNVVLSTRAVDSLVALFLNNADAKVSCPNLKSLIVGQTDDETFQQDDDDMPEINAQAAEPVESTTEESAMPAESTESAEPTVAPADESTVETVTKESDMSTESTESAEFVSFSSDFLEEVMGSADYFFGMVCDRHLPSMPEVYTVENVKKAETMCLNIFGNLRDLLADSLDKAYNEYCEAFKFKFNELSNELARKADSLRKLNARYALTTDFVKQAVINRNNVMALIKKYGSDEGLAEDLAKCEQVLAEMQARVEEIGKAALEAGGSVADLKADSKADDSNDDSNDGGPSVDAPAAPVQPNDGGTADASPKSDDVAPQATEHFTVADDPTGLENAFSVVEKATAPSHDVAEHSPKLVDAVLNQGAAPTIEKATAPTVSSTDGITVRRSKRRSSASGDAAPAVEKATAPSDAELAERRHSKFASFEAKLAEFETTQAAVEDDSDELSEVTYGIYLANFAALVALAVNSVSDKTHSVNLSLHESHKANSNTVFSLIDETNKNTVLKFAYNGGDGVRVVSPGEISADIALELGIKDTETFLEFLARKGIKLHEGRFLTK